MGAEPEDKGYAVKERRWAYGSEGRDRPAEQPTPGASDTPPSAREQAGAGPGPGPGGTQPAASASPGAAQGARSPAGPEPGQTRAPRELDFATFILQLSSAAVLHFGDLPDPVTEKRQKDLALAKETIDLLGLLQEKTKGNLTPDEEALMEGVLYDLRMRYIQEVSAK